MGAMLIMLLAMIELTNATQLKKIRKYVEGAGSYRALKQLRVYETQLVGKYHHGLPMVEYTLMKVQDKIQEIDVSARPGAGLTDYKKLTGTKAQSDTSDTEERR